MSKYIDAERLNMEWETLKPFGVTDTMIENLKWIVDRQPTIEVSEDCIDRDLIISQLLNFMSVEKEHYEGMNKALKLIEHAPSVVSDFKTFCGVPIEEAIDVLEKHTTEQSSIVHCKDCKHWNDFYSKCTKWTVDTYEQAQTNAEDFCSYGERIDNE